MREMRDALASVDAHLAAAVDRARARRHDFAHPVGWLSESDDVRENGHAVAAPPGEVGYDHVLAEVQLRLEEQPPAAGEPAAGRPVERPAEVRPDARRRERVRSPQRWPRATAFG